MSDNRLPTEVELAYEVMPCQAMRVSQEPGASPHACSYFREWGSYHSYGYESERPPLTAGIVQRTQYLGRGALVPELLSGCRKAPIMAVGINPNLPGWWPATRNSINPLFDDCKQYAHYFRYRETAKLDIPMDRYLQYLHGRSDGPFSKTELDVPTDDQGFRTIPVELQQVSMYQNYQSLLEDLAKTMGWKNHRLTIGEDVSYGNMVACPSAKWINRKDPNHKTMPFMTENQQQGIVAECFHHRQYFLRQLFQSLPAVLMVFSQSTTDAFLAEMAGRFGGGDPKPGDLINELLGRDIRLRFGQNQQGKPIEAQVIFSPHITGDPQHFQAVRAKVLAGLVMAAQSGRLAYNSHTGHLRRPQGGCVFCTMLEIGPCDYVEEIQPLVEVPPLTANSSAEHLQMEKKNQHTMLQAFLSRAPKRDTGRMKHPRLKKRHVNAPGLETTVALAAPEAVRLVAEAAAHAADVGWTLAGDPSRQEDRKLTFTLTPAENGTPKLIARKRNKSGSKQNRKC